MKEYYKWLIAGVSTVAMLTTVVGCGTTSSLGNGGSKISVGTSSTTTGTAILANQTPTQASQQSLKPVTYSSPQLREIAKIASSQKMTSNPLVLSHSWGNTGIYKLVSVSGSQFVLTLRYENLAVYESRYFDNLFTALDAFMQGSKMTLERNVTLNGGQKAQWRKISYSSGNEIQLLTLYKNETWIAIVPPSSQSVHQSIIQTIAEQIVPLNFVYTK